MTTMGCDGLGSGSPTQLFIFIFIFATSSDHLSQIEKPNQKPIFIIKTHHQFVLISTTRTGLESVSTSREKIVLIHFFFQWFKHLPSSSKPPSIPLPAATTTNPSPPPPNSLPTATTTKPLPHSPSSPPTTSKITP